MNKDAIAVFFGVCAILLSGESTSFSQNLEGTSLSVSGTGTIEVLNSGTATIGVLTSSRANLNALNLTGSAALQGGLTVSGTVDLLGNNLCFGSWLSDPAMPGVVFTYTDAVTTPTAMPSRLTLWATQPSHEWLWAHSTVDQTSTIPMMKLDANHVLTLYDVTGNPAIVLDPAHTGGTNGVLTQSVADARYFPANAGLSALSGKIGIGTATPAEQLSVSAASGTAVRIYTGDPSGVAEVVSSNSPSSSSIKVENTGGGGKTWGLHSTASSSLAGAGKFAIRNETDGRWPFTIDANSNVLLGGTMAYATPTMYVAGNGNVGIGTTSPSSKLNVLGVTSLQSGDIDGGIKIGADISATTLTPNVEKFGRINAPSYDNAHNFAVLSAQSTSATGDYLAIGGAAGSRVPAPVSISFVTTGTAGSATGNKEQMKITNSSITVNPPITVNSPLSTWYWCNMTQDDPTYPRGAVSSIVSITGSGNLTGYLGVRGFSAYARMDDYRGTISQATAVYADVMTIGTSGRIDQGIGVCVDTPISTGGTIGNIYGVYVYKQMRSNVTGTAFGFYQAGLNDINYFNGNVGLGTSSPQARLDVNGSAKIAGNLTISGTGSLTLPDGTVLSSSNTLRGVMATGTAATISGTMSVSHVSGLAAVATSGDYTSLTGRPVIPTDNSQLANGAGYITSSGTAAYASVSGSAAVLTGTVQATQISGLAAVATGGNLDYAKLGNAPTNVSAFANDAGYIVSSGTAADITLSGSTNFTGAAFLGGGQVVIDANGDTLDPRGNPCTFGPHIFIQKGDQYALGDAGTQAGAALYISSGTGQAFGLYPNYYDGRAVMTVGDWSKPGGIDFLSYISIGAATDDPSSMVVTTGSSGGFGERLRITSGDTANFLIKNSKVGIGTAAPAAQLHVAGSGRFDGPVRIEPQGDLDMGQYTADPQGNQ